MDDGSSKPWLPGQTPAQLAQCPVDPGAQRWIESSLRWCANEFGAGVLGRDVVLPSADFLSEVGYCATPQQIDTLTRHVCELMMVDPQRFELEIFDRPEERAEADRAGRGRAVGHFRMAGGRAIIALDQAESADPRVLAAIVAHELCHLRLLGEGRIPASRPDGERLTDLLTVFFGLGIFSANAALGFARARRGWIALPSGQLDDRTLNAARHHDGYRRLGYLSSAEFGYALSCYCWLRGEPAPGWTRHVNPGPRVHLDQGLAYLRRVSTDGELPTQLLLGKPLQVGSATIRVAYSTAASPGPASLMLPGTAVRPADDDVAARAEPPREKLPGKTARAQSRHRRKR
jgi:hypothetical protein